MHADSSGMHSVPYGTRPDSFVFFVVQKPGFRKRQVEPQSSRRTQRFLVQAVKCALIIPMAYMTMSSSVVVRLSLNVRVR